MADIKIACGSAALNTGTGVQALTIASLGWTPKAAIFIVSRGLTDGTSANGFSFSVGAAVGDLGGGGAEFAIATQSEHGVGGSDVDRYAVNNECIFMMDITGAIDGEATGNGDGLTTNPGPIADGWRINITDAFAAAYLCKFVLFGGTDLDANIILATAADGTKTLSASTGTGQFEADILFAVGAAQAINDSGGSFFNGTYGLGWNTTVDVNRVLATQQAAASDPTDNRYIVDTGAIAGQHTTSWAWETAADTYTSTGFDLSTTGSDGGDQVGILALGFGGNSVKVGSINAPVSAASDWVVTDAGFQPGFVLLMESYLTAEDTFTTDATAGAAAFSMFDGTRSHTIGASAEDGAGTSGSPTTTNTQNLAHNQFLYMASPDGTVVFDAVSPTFSATGWTITAANITAADTTARKWVYLAVAANAAAGGLTIPIAAYHYNHHLRT